MRKKIISILLITMSIFWCTAVPMISASESDTNIELKESRDLNELYIRALNGISDIEKQEEQTITKSLVPENKANQKQFDIDINFTTILLDEKVVNGDVIQEYETIIFQVAQDKKDKSMQRQIDKLKSDDLAGSIGTYAKNEKDKWDDTRGVKAFSVVTWSSVTKNGTEHYKMSNVSGKWEYNGLGGYILSKRSVIFGQVGPSLYGGTNTQRTTKYPTTNSFSYAVPSTWNPVVATDYTTCGVTTNITITRGGLSWTLQLINMAG
ncbi:hypothetical protein LG275_10165 [Chryseomicrobium palamuruense]